MGSTKKTRQKGNIDPIKWLDDHGDALYAFALMRVREPSQAEDLVQETLLAALGAVDNFKGESTERTWLTGILKHKVLDHLRRSGREKPLSDEDEANMEKASMFDETGLWTIKPGNWTEPERSLEQEQFWNTMSNCVEKLPEKLRTIYVLREFDGIETDVLLETLNISSKNNLWVMLSRARLQLRHCLETNWFTN
jgi:RNA polymerase sigma-70 factor (ECF subfamily)